MCKILSIFLLFLFSQVVSGQNISLNKVYDSTKNYLGKDANLYVGQTLQFNKAEKNPDDPPLMFHERQYFVLDKNKQITDSSNEKYFCTPNQTQECSTNYDSINNKKFKVFGVWPYPNQSNYINNNRFYLGLVRENTNDTCYYLYNSENSYSSPFIVTGYLIRLKQLGDKEKLSFIDKEFIVDDFLPFTVDQTIFKSGDAWRCTDFYSIGGQKMIDLENSDGKRTSVKFSGDKDFIDEEHIFISKTIVNKRKAEANRILKKYGSKIGQDILDGKVSIGWTKEMCELSWGPPDHINKTITAYSTTEQWVYSNSYLYFNGNKLTAIQQ